MKHIPPALILAALFLSLAAAVLPAQDADLGDNIFWEEPRILLERGARFPNAVGFRGGLIVIWQEFVAAGEAGGDIYLSAMISPDGRTWTTNPRFAGPFRYQGREVPIFSLATDEKGAVYCAIAVAEDTTRILQSTDWGMSFQPLSTVKASTTIVSPSLFITSRRLFLLVVTQKTENFLALHYAVSRNGSDWTAFTPLEPKERLPVNFLPFHTVFEGKDYLVFQGLAPGETVRYQLFLKPSSDGGMSFGPAVPITFREFIEGEQQEMNQFSNQRPQMHGLRGRLLLVWERQFRNRNPQVYLIELDGAGKILSEPVPITGGLTPAYFPQIVVLKGKPLLLWFDGRKGEDHIILAEQRGIQWVEKDLSPMAGASSFPRPAVSADRMFLFWENRVGQASRLVLLEPDQSVEPPQLRAVNFDPVRESRQERIRVTWNVPRDSSGIAGFGYSWSVDPNAALERTLRLQNDATTLQLEADRDGKWIFRLSAQDYAGNWSKPSSITFNRDTSPPAKVRFQEPAKDENGFLTSNSITLSWQPPPDPGVEGYTYSLQVLESPELPAAAGRVSLAPPPGRILTAQSQVSYNNLDDGTWALSVSAIDRAGNIGEAEVLSFKLNKYIPVTIVNAVSGERDILGGLDLTITGRGFTRDGMVDHVILDRDGKQPYDFTFRREDGLFRVPGDRRIDGLRLTEFEDGEYWIGVRHPLRGIAFSAGRLRLQSSGTVKFGDFRFVYVPPWEKARRVSLFYSVTDFTVWLTVLFFAVLISISVGKLASITKEGVMIRQEMALLLREGAQALLEQDRLKARREEARMEELKRKGAGLRLKFTLLTMVLVVLIVLMVSVPLGLFMTRTQQRNLAEALIQRVEVLMDSLATRAGTFLLAPDQYRIELSQLPQQMEAMTEATFATITGQGSGEAGRFDYLWATNDPAIGRKLPGGKFNPAEDAGKVRLEDELVQVAGEVQKKVAESAKARVEALRSEADRIAGLARQVALADPKRLKDLQEESSRLNAEISAELRRIGSIRGSLPEFSFDALADSYTFYKPVVATQSGVNNYYWGMVRLGVSTEKIRSEIARSRIVLIRQTGIIALISAALGVLGAVLMASITIIPIKKLAAAVVMIRDTEDKEKLKDHRIDIRSKDEIGMLAETVNQMTQALVKAAVASKDLTVGKEVQRMFLPLERDAMGNKGSTGREETEHVEIFGYYEGAKGVSGDYFDFLKLQDPHDPNHHTYYAVVKCDVAGKGVPAALIMVEVATIFLTSFRNWSLKSPGLKIDPLVYRINDMLEERGFKGRFAALTLCLINANTGQASICNAGDTTLHMYDGSEGKMQTYDLPKAPAAGVFPSMMVETQSGFKAIPRLLKKGDTLFLFTDGIEEAKRVFRDNRFREIVCAEKGLKDQESHGGTHVRGSGSEEMGLERIHTIINAVFSRSRFQLQKYHNPVADEELVFDFSSCQGSVEEAVLAMVAVEKIFRIYLDPQAGSKDRILVDRRIEEFLKKTFLAYPRYFAHPLGEASPDQKSILAFSHLKEDEQYDDLTILAVRKR